MPQNDKAIALTRRDFKKLMDLRKLANSGTRVEAKRVLSQLKNLLENMRTGQMAQMSPRGQKSIKLVNQLQSLIKEQQELLDQTFRDARERGQLNPRPSEPRFRRPGDLRFDEMRPTIRVPAKCNPALRSLGRRAKAHRYRKRCGGLGELMRQLGEMTNSDPAHGPGEQSMRRSTDFLRAMPGRAMRRKHGPSTSQRKRQRTQRNAPMGQGRAGGPIERHFVRTPDGGPV